MPKRFVRKLEKFTTLSDEDKRVLEDAASDTREFGPREDIIREGDRPDYVHLMVEGWAVRYKLLPNGNRAILAYLIPGDLCDIHVTLYEMDHSIATLSPCKVACIRGETISRIMREHERLPRALWWSTLVNEAILREWLVTVGYLPADKRLAHFICEMLLRTKAVGLTGDDSFELPLTQEELADSIGMSAVHMNRMLQELRGLGADHERRQADGRE